MPHEIDPALHYIIAVEVLKNKSNRCTRTHKNKKQMVHFDIQETFYSSARRRQMQTPTNNIRFRQNNFNSSISTAGPNHKHNNNPGDGSDRSAVAEPGDSTPASITWSQKYKQSYYYSAPG